MRVIRQIIRGARDLPGVGPHPGTDLLVLSLFVGALAEVGKGGLWGALVGALVMLVGLTPLWMWGCYERAELSDRRRQRLLKYLGQPPE